MMPQTLDELRQWLTTELPKWLKEYPELRDTLESVLSDVFVRKDEWQRVVDALERLAEGQLSLQRSTEELQRTTRELQQTLQEVLRQQAEHSRILQEHSRTLEEHTRILQEHSRTLQEHTRILEEHSRILQEHTHILEEHTRILQEHSEMLIELRKGQERHEQLLQEHGRLIARLDARIGALGRRWGMESEATFREAMYKLLAPLGYVVERFLVRDEEGIVFGRPDQVEIDLLIRDGEVIAVEMRASVSKSDVAVFLRKLEFLERVFKRTVTKAVIISPFIDDDARRFAEEMGIEVYELPDEMREQRTVDTL